MTIFVIFAMITAFFGVIHFWQHLHRDPIIDSFFHDEEFSFEKFYPYRWTIVQYMIVRLSYLLFLTLTIIIGVVYYVHLWVHR